MQELMGVFVSEAGRFLHGFETNMAPHTTRRRFVAHFGVSPKHCACLWQTARRNLIASDPHMKHAHLLWALNVLKTDNSEHALKGRWGADEKTIRKWLCIALDVIGTMGAVSVEDVLSSFD